MNIPFRILSMSLLLLLFGCSKENTDSPVEPEVFSLAEIVIDGKSNQDVYTDVNPNLAVTLTFSSMLDASLLDANILLKDKSGSNVGVTIDYDNNKTIVLKPKLSLTSFSRYELVILPNLKAKSGVKIVTGKVFSINIGFDLTDKFPRISDEELLNLVQKQTFNYFWDFGHPTSGMARERTTSADVVTTGGTGFGVMAMVVAAQRGFITRNEAVARVNKIATFLSTKCSRYHGAFSHWVNGQTGETVAFSSYDDGADLVETALLFQGLLTAKAYFDANDAAEVQLRNNITHLWEGVEWTWFQKGGENVLYWHWSPTYGWQVNLKVAGWNESLIVYVLAASSPTYPISKNVYNEGWARNGAIKNGASFYGYNLPLGSDFGGPLFFSHYSFLGINPKGLTDQYADYWLQNTNHTLINYKYCVENPKSYAGYSTNCWGLTASDGNAGYSAHSPSNDKGVIAPTAALSSMPYTPNESMQALHFFYYKLGDKLWGNYGFVDAFNLSQNWFDNQNLAIDQGPIIGMIENHRTGLLWSLFMSIPEIKDGMKKLGFQSPVL